MFGVQGCFRQRFDHQEKRQDCSGAYVPAGSCRVDRGKKREHQLLGIDRRQHGEFWRRSLAGGGSFRRGRQLIRFRSVVRRACLTTCTSGPVTSSNPLPPPDFGGRIRAVQGRGHVRPPPEPRREPRNRLLRQAVNADDQLITILGGLVAFVMAIGTVLARSTQCILQSRSAAAKSRPCALLGFGGGAVVFLPGGGAADFRLLEGLSVVLRYCP